jgi:hypothetical protein
LRCWIKAVQPEIGVTKPPRRRILRGAWQGSFETGIGGLPRRPERAENTITIL